MARKKKQLAEPKTEVADAQKCSSCDSELKKMLWDNRHKGFSVLVCDNRACDLYRQFQGKEGEIPEGVNIRFV